MKRIRNIRFVHLATVSFPFIHSWENAQNFLNKSDEKIVLVRVKKKIKRCLFFCKTFKTECKLFDSLKCLISELCCA